MPTIRNYFDRTMDETTTTTTVFAEDEWPVETSTGTTTSVSSSTATNMPTQGSTSTESDTIQPVVTAWEHFAAFNKETRIVSAVVHTIALLVFLLLVYKLYKSKTGSHSLTHYQGQNGAYRRRSPTGFFPLRTATPRRDTPSAGAIYRPRNQQLHPLVTPATSQEGLEEICMAAIRPAQAAQISQDSAATTARMSQQSQHSAGEHQVQLHPEQQAAAFHNQPPPLFGGHHLVNGDDTWASRSSEV